MATEQFNIQITAIPNTVNNIIVAMIVIGVVIIATGLALGKLLKEKKAAT